jgi:HlyD family secretion protein
MWTTRLRFAALALALVGAGLLPGEDKKERLPPKLITSKVADHNLQLKYVERGTLQSMEPNFLRCEVKAGSRGAPKIKWVVENGSAVKKGDLIVEIDDSYLQEQAKTQKIEREKAQIDMETAELLLKDKPKADRADLEAKRAVFRKQDARYQELLAQIKLCKVYAPRSGTVIYYVPEQRRMGGGGPYPIELGEPVLYGQTMLSVPDLSQMVVQLRIPAAVITQIRKGMQATVRVDALPGKTLKAHVHIVANAAEALEWSPPTDVKFHAVVLQVDDVTPDLKLKPGLSAVCTIYSDKRAEKVLAVPFQAVLLGKKPRCLVVTPRGQEEREVELGLIDENMVEIKSGLKEGDEVVTNPRR